MTKWDRVQLTSGSESGIFHSHAYYDIPVFDSESRLLAGHKVTFQERQPVPSDKIEIGYVDTDDDQKWTAVGVSRAWSWQQGAMSQWLPGKKDLIWNDREDGQFISRIYSVNDGTTKMMKHPVYAVDPDGKYFLSLNMARLDYVRPGYGYPGGRDHKMDDRSPADDGVWKVNTLTGRAELILTLREASKLVLSQLSLKERLRHFVRRYVYWFNHVKISPDGSRFTIKLRYRPKDLSMGWNDKMGASLTCGIDGSDLRLLTPAASHVIWLDTDHLYLWKGDGVYLYKDTKYGGKKTGQIAKDFISDNVHIRHLPGEKNHFIYDTPYRESIDLFSYRTDTDTREKITTFNNHKPARGHFRCDLHPCPSPDGKKIVVTSLEDGGRQIYLLLRKE